MSAVGYLVLAAGGILTAVLWRLWVHLRHEGRERGWLPQELRGARLAFAERLFRTRRPFGLLAKIDRAYATTTGGLALVELKRRYYARVYRSDVVELSAQKLAIERGAGRRVADVGWVVVEHPDTGQRTPIAVPLIPEQEMVTLRHRYQQLLLGAVVPAKTNELRLCRTCVYADRCRPEVLGEGFAIPGSDGTSDLGKVVHSPELEQLSAMRARDGRGGRRRMLERSPETPPTKARSSRRSDRSRKV